MRPIKFRAWDKRCGDMLFPDMIQFDTPEPSREPALVGFPVPHGYGTAPLSTVELMQFTGLLDKNGTEIYEGDVVRGHRAKTLPNGNIDPNESEEFTRAVEWGATIIDCGFNLMTCQAKHYEIIGNIYENPELLGAKP